MNKERSRQIKRGGVASISPKLVDRIRPKYCPRCEALGIRNSDTILGDRKYLPNERKPADAKDWLQCYFCGHLIHRIHVQEEGELVSEIEELDSPYEEVSGRILGIEKRKLGKTGKHERTKIMLIKDEDVKQSLKKGSKLISYSETQP